MLSVEEALERVFVAVGGARARAETVPLADALGRVLAEDVAMDHDVPPFRRAAMDGYAVCRADGVFGAVVRVVGQVAAGEATDVPVGPGEAVRIMTGAPLPAGADVVVPVEHTRLVETGVRVERRVEGAGNVVGVGEHVRVGEQVLSRGRLLSPGDLGVLATAGRARVEVAARPTVAVLGTGSELVDVAAKPGPAEIRNSNTWSLLAAARQHGATPVALGTVVDEMGALRAAIRGGLSHDLLVLSGGVSRGDLDLVPAALEAEGVASGFHRWAVQPGGPLWFGMKGNCLVFGLPGNPAASFVGFEVLAVPALRARMGLPFAARRTLRALYGGPWGGPKDRRRYRPVRLRSEASAALRAEPVPWKGSGDPFGIARGDALAILPEGDAGPQSGDRVVEVLPLGDLLA